MTDEQLINLIRARGALRVAQDVSEHFLSAALERGEDYTNWQVSVTAGAALFYQVDRPAPAARGIFVSPGVGAYVPPEQRATANSAPRVCVINTAYTAEWDAVERDVEPGVKTTFIYNDGVIHVADRTAVFHP